MTLPTSPTSPILDDLLAEQAVLDDLVSGLDERQWSTPTPAETWTIRDQIAHLALFDDVATASLTGTGEARFAEMYAAMNSGATTFIDSPADGRSGTEVLAAWRRARTAEAEAFRRVDPAARVPWGPNLMAPPSLCTARLMETWAHGLDCLAALGVTPVDGDRLRHVCHITYRAIPNALMAVGLSMPAPIDDLVVEVISPAGHSWRFGPAHAPNRIEGTAGEFARVGVRRMRLDEASTLRAHGPLAEVALPNLKAYL
jgi:uncharacterized protein (TIGR03084 family)